MIHGEGPRNKWKLAQVVELHLGQDKIPRVATVRTAELLVGQNMNSDDIATARVVSKTLMRPIVRLYPLELHQDLEEREPVSPEIESSDRPSRRAAREAAAARRALVESGQL